MKHITRGGGLTLALMVVGTSALAQYTGPAQEQVGGYAGPSSVPRMTSKQLISDGRDDQFVFLQGRIVSFDGGQSYTFADESGRVSVEISANRFPPGQPISAEQRVELLVEVDKDVLTTEFEVEHIRLLP